MILNCLKLSISGVLSLKAAAILGDVSLVVPILLVAVITLTPVVFFKVLYQNKSSLDTQTVRDAFGSMYGGKNVHQKQSKVFLYPFLYFWRRFIFAIVTVYLFPYPVMQMVVHHLMTMLTVILLISSERAFET